LALKQSWNWSKPALLILYPSGISPTNKKTHKNSQNFGKIFRLLKIPQIFLNFDHIKNSEENSSEILPASQTKKPDRKKCLIYRKNLWILKFLNLSGNFSELRFFLDRTKPWSIFLVELDLKHLCNYICKELLQYLKKYYLPTDSC
jgi:hypothetical protein